jgi:hypothetical protein
MIGPTRLRNESASDLERALLDAGSSYHGTASARAKTMAALGLAGSATLIAGTASATGLFSAAKLTWTKLIAGVSLAGAAAAVPVGYQVWQKHHEAARPAVVAMAPAPVATSPEREAARLSLTRELAAVDAARATLARGEARKALSLLDAYTQNHPHGRLELEAEVLRIDALARSGQADAAKVRAQAFLRRHPNSVLAARVRAHAQPTE